MKNYFVPGRPTPPHQFHLQLLQIVEDILRRCGCRGTTTGQILEHIKIHHVRVYEWMLAATESMTPRDRTQRMKTDIGHALRTLEEAGIAHQDNLMRERRTGDEKSVPVWRTMEDFLQLEAMLRVVLNFGYKPSGPGGKNYPRLCREKYARGDRAADYGTLMGPKADKTAAPSPSEYEDNQDSSQPSDGAKQNKSDMDSILKWFDNMGNNLTGRE